MIRSLHIKNFKSVHDCEIALGRINVFIGENGSGKTNILEALGYAAALVAGNREAEDLYGRGIRVAGPSMMLSSFEGRRQGRSLALTVGFEGDSGPTSSVELQDTLLEDPKAQEKSELAAQRMSALIVLLATALPPTVPGGALATALATALAAGPTTIKHLDQEETAKAKKLKDELALAQSLHAFLVYNPNILALRGLEVASRREPVGLHGEGLDILLASMDDVSRTEVFERARCICWLDQVLLDRDDELKYSGHKRMRSTSRLYFRDRYMQKKNNLFSAENANEGILHILFYLALFSSRDTPPVFGIDNIETALNPQLCRDLIKQLAELAKKNNKQALITTHNPAVLDGLNLHDDEQRLFVVSRSDAGHTVAERIRVKPQPEGNALKLSELWMRGYLGGLPQGF